jgi:hypothetical protein
MMPNDVLRSSFVNCWWNDTFHSPHIANLILSRHDMLLLLIGMLFLLCKKYMVLILINSCNISSSASSPIDSSASACPSILSSPVGVSTTMRTGQLVPGSWSPSYWKILVKWNLRFPNCCYQLEGALRHRRQTVRYQKHQSHFFNILRKIYEVVNVAARRSVISSIVCKIKRKKFTLFKEVPLK